MRALPLLQILDLARWAPSGDNEQVWRFEVVDEHRFVIHGRDTRDHCVYDLDGRASLLALGALIETATIAASAHGLVLSARRRTDADPTRPTFDVQLSPSAATRPDPLIKVIPTRSVQRRPLRTRALSPVETEALEMAVGPGYRLHWLATGGQRLRAAALLFTSAKIRLTTPEAFEVHRNIIHWDRRYSDDRVPSQALGVDAVSVALMRFGLQSWQRVHFMNRFLMGTVLPRLQMDLLPGLCCAAHVAIVADVAPNGADDDVAAGRAVQRLWLTAERLGVRHQPEMTPLIFHRYAREGRRFTSTPGPLRLADGVADRFDQLVGGQAHRVVWFGRLGHGPASAARSGRRALADLLVSPPAAAASTAGGSQLATEHSLCAF